MIYNKISRRAFLQGASGFALAIPLLPSLLEREVRAQMAGARPRFIGIMSRNGAVSSNAWYPAALPSIANALPGSPGNTVNIGQGHSIYSESLRTLQGGRGNALSPVIGPAFDSILDRVNMIRGLDVPMYLGHHRGGTLGNFIDADQVNRTGMTSMPTIDQVISASMVSNPERAFSVAINPESNNLTISFAGVGNPAVTVHQYPMVLFRQLFCGGTACPPDASPSPSPSPVASPTPSLIDLVIDDYRRLMSRANRRISSEDRLRLDAHVTSLRDIQTRLGGGPSPSPGASPAPAPGNCRQLTEADINSRYPRNASNQVIPFINQDDTLGLTNIAAYYHIFNDVLAAGIRCGLIRTATITISRATYRFDAGPGTNNWHEWSHNPGLESYQTNLTNTNRWIAENIFADLASKLEQSTDADGQTCLRNSLVMWGHEEGCVLPGYAGANVDVHYLTSVPILTAGEMGGRLNAGLYLDYRNRNSALCNNGERIGVPYNRFLVTLLQGMGLRWEDYRVHQLNDPNNSYLPGYGDTMIRNDLMTQRTQQYNFGLVDTPLPLLFRS
ncbi:MAG: DUF1552 domain-containing protein [Bdellovibrionota bacterium]